MSHNAGELTARFASHISNLQFGQIPAATQTAAKKSIMDMIGVMTPPSSLDASCQRLFDFAKSESNGGDCSFVGFGEKGSATMAAFINGCCAHILDYDDTIDSVAHHPSAQTVPAALAVAQKIGGVSGQEFIAAVVAGGDLGARLSAAPNGKLGKDFHWFPISNFGVFSATAAAARILRLSEGETINALGLALHRCHGELGAITAPESELRGIRDGFINKEGVICAFMAQQGVQACHDAIERFFQIYYHDDFDADALTKNLGQEFRTEEVSIKPWPSCRVTHGYIDGVRQLLTEHKIDAGSIAEIICEAPKGTIDYFCEPEAIKRAPELSIQAKFSLYFAVAVGATKAPEISDFLPEHLTAPQVVQMARKIHCRIGDEYTSEEAVIAPVTVHIRTANGQEFTRRVDNVYGHPSNPITDQDLRAKFLDCMQYARNPISTEQSNSLFDAVLALDTVADISEISALLP